MHPSLDNICRAHLHAASLPALAPLRCEPDVELAEAGADLWLRWPPSNERILRIVLPLAGVTLYAQHDGLWFRPGRALPAFDVPAVLDFRPLFQVLFPAPVQPLLPPAYTAAPAPLALKRDTRPRPATALVCRLAALLAWADGVPAQRLASLQGLLLDGDVLVVGARLPEVAGERFWGATVLTPLGCCPDPELRESALRAAAGVEDGDLLLLRDQRADIVACTLLAPLSRACLRLAAEEVTP